MTNKDIEITFWGVRGSCPTFNPRMQEFGGNTSCVQMQIQNRLLIFDGGTGMHQLGKFLAEKNNSLRGDIFITHTHWDHIQGLPFFTPFFETRNYFKIYGENKKEIIFSDVIKDIMKYPYSPITWNDMDALLVFQEVESNQTLDIGDGITVSTIATDHPGGCISYKVKYKDKSCCYITDLEHKQDLHHNLKDFVKNSDILIYDSNYTEEEYFGENNKPSKEGWGHSTWERGIELVIEANVKKLVLFHHDSNRFDEELKKIELKAQAIHTDTIAARENMKICL